MSDLRGKRKAGMAGRRRCLILLGAPLLFGMIAPRAHAGAYDDFFRAAKTDDAATVKSLLARGLDPNIIEPQRGETAMMLALREGSMDVFDVLVNARDIDLEVRASNGDTALMIAAYKENRRAVEALLQKGAEVNKTGWTPLHYAAYVGNNEIVAMLLEKHAYIDAESPNKTTPLMMAAWGGHILTVKLLLDEGADLTLKNEKGMTAADIADRYGHRDIAEGLAWRLNRSGKR